MKKYIIISSLIVTLVGGVFALQYFPGESEPAPIGSSTSPVTLETYTNSIKVTGTARLAYEQKLRFIQGGRVTNVLVKPGQMVEKGALLATLDMTEFNESVTQAQDRVTLSQKRLASAREKTSETEIRKLESELQSMEAKRAFSQQDLAKLVKTAPVKTEAKRSELAQKKSDLTSKEASYALDKKILEADIQNKATMIDKKLAESKKITESILQTAPADFSDLQTVRNGINKIFSFDITKVTDDDRSKAYYHGWNVTGLRNMTQIAWRDINTSIADVQTFLDSIEGKPFTRENALTVSNLLLTAETKSLDMVDKAKRTIDNTDVYGGALTLADIEMLKTTINGYRTSTLAKINARKENQNSIALTASGDIITAQVEKELSDRKQVLMTQQVAIEKMRIEIQEAEAGLPRFTLSGAIDPTVRREIEEKKQSLLEADIAILQKGQDIKKMRSGKSDDITTLENDLKQANSELKKILAKREQYEMHAPIRGMIRSVKVLVGDNISTSSTTGNEGTITIEDNNAVMVVAKLNQKDIVKINQNQAVSITLDTFPDISFSGKVVEISSSPDEGGGGGETLYEIRILFDRGKHSIYSGMSANIVIPLSSESGVVFLPLSAVKTDPNSGEKTVTVIKNGMEETRIITIGFTDTDRVQVLSGVTAGEEVKTLNFDPNTYKTPDSMIGPMGGM